MTVERIIESCTTPAASELVFDAGLEELKAFLKNTASADAAAETLFAALSTRLQLPDPQIRLLAFRIVNHFFTRSKAFRRTCLSQLSILLDCGLGNAQRRSEQLPPGAATSELKHFVLHCLAKWKMSFSHLYPEILMACQYVEGQLKLRLPDGTAPYVSLHELEEQTQRRNAYRKSLRFQRDLFRECRQARTEISHILELVDQSALEWADLPVASENQSSPTKPMVSDAGWDDAPMKVDGTSNEKTAVKEVEWMDPVLEENLCEHLALIEKRYHPKLQFMITAATRVFTDDLTSQEAAAKDRILSEAVRLRNELLDQRNRIEKLGVRLIQRRRSKTRTPANPVPTRYSRLKRRKVETADPTQAKPNTPCIMRNTSGCSELESSEIKDRQSDSSCQDLAEKDLTSLFRSTQTPVSVLRSLLNSAPNLSHDQAKAVLQSQEWKESSHPP